MLVKQTVNRRQMKTGHTLWDHHHVQGLMSRPGWGAIALEDVLVPVGQITLGFQGATAPSHQVQDTCMKFGCRLQYDPCAGKKTVQTPGQKRLCVLTGVAPATTPAKLGRYVYSDLPIE
jgi:hypothetical protein